MAFIVLGQAGGLPHVYSSRMKWNYLALGLLAVLIVLTTAWRVQQARESLWIDELHSAWCAGGELREVAPRAASGNQSPLYFWLLWGQSRLVAPSEIALRAPSLLANALLMAALYGIAAHWLRSAWLGLLAALLVALDPPPHLYAYFATEARPYALVMLVATLHAALFARLCRRPTWQLRAAFILGAALLFHLHYTAALLLPAELLFWLVARLRRLLPVHYTSRQLTLDVALIGVTWLPAGLLVGDIFGRRQNWTAFVEQRPFLELFELLPWSAAALIVLAGVLVERYLIELPRGQRSPDLDRLRLRQLAILCLCWLLVPMSLAWLATWTDVARLAFPRYLVASLPAAVLLAVICVRLPPWKWLQFVLGAALAAGASFWSFSAKMEPREVWREAIAQFNEQLPQQPYPVLLVSNLIEDQALRQADDERLTDYCLFPLTSLYPVAAPQRDLLPLPSRGAGLLTAEQRDWLRSRGGAWLIVRTLDHRAANADARLLAEELTGDLTTNPWAVKLSHTHRGVHLILVLPQRSNEE